METCRWPLRGVVSSAIVSCWYWCGRNSYWRCAGKDALGIALAFFIGTHPSLVQGWEKKFVVNFGALHRRQFLEPEAERCCVGKLAMRRIILPFLFFHFLRLRVLFSEKIILAVDAKKQFLLRFLVRSLKKYEKKHEPFLMMVTTLIFTPKRKSLVFSRSAAVWQRAHG